MVTPRLLVYNGENYRPATPDEVVAYVMERDGLKETLFDLIDDEFYGDDDD
jgi:hypothetical protein